jgi:hypothetical protein
MDSKVAGYADSNGFAESDSPRLHAWRYRNYVIRCFNADMPRTQFVTEQLAGDELGGCDARRRAASGARSSAARQTGIASPWIGPPLLLVSDLKQRGLLDSTVVH